MMVFRSCPGESFLVALRCSFVLTRPNMAAGFANTAVSDAVCFHWGISLRALQSWGFKGTVRAGTGPRGWGAGGGSGRLLF